MKDYSELTEKGKKIRDAKVKKYGSLEAFQEAMREAGRKGGYRYDKGGPRGFAAMREKDPERFRQIIEERERKRREKA